MWLSRQRGTMVQGAEGDVVKDIALESMAPMILHVDVNKSIIISDMIMNKSVEYTIREVIANQFWGHVVAKEGVEEPVWVWDGRGASPLPSEAPIPTPSAGSGASVVDTNGTDTAKTKDARVSYLAFCRKKIKDKQLSRLATRSFDLAGDAECKKQMNDTAEAVIEKMTIAAKERTDELTENTGLQGEWRLIFPSFFRKVAHMQQRGCKFSIFFRSFGSDLPRIRIEWNAFCEMRHPLYNHYLEGIGPMDGSVDGVPDRRLGEEDLHTMYRDKEGTLLALNVMTNGNWEGEWDQWARSENATDTRDGRNYFKENGLRILNGYNKIRGWMRQQVRKGRSQLIRDDFAWWHWNSEVSSCGKAMVGIKDVSQIFFDDNIGADGLRIVDARCAKTFESVDQILQPGMCCVRVDTLRAMLTEDYFKEELEQAASNIHGLRSPDSADEAIREARWKGYTSSDEQDDEEEQDMQASSLSRKRGSWKEKDPHLMQLQSTDDSSSDALEVTDADHLDKVLRDSGVDVEKFGATGTTYKTVATLFNEIKEGKCFLKRDVDRDSLGGSQSEPAAGGDEAAKEKTIMPIVRVLEVVRVKLSCNNMILCEAHEQMSDGRMRSRNGYLPATKRRRGETLLEAVGRWSIEELQIKLTDEQKQEAVKSVTEKYDVTDETMSFPIPCATHYFELNCSLRSDKMEPVLLDRIGLPSGSMFSTAAVKKKKGAAAQKAGSRMFWSWYRKEVWEAMQLTEAVELPDVQAGMELLFKGNTRRKGYSALLLQMFDCFTASHLAGGMSGSLVLQVQPVDPIDGKNQEPVIVKLDKADVVSREIVFSKRVCNVLSDRAARILGDGCFVTEEGVEYGAFKIELAGGCWQVPELAGGSKAKDLLSTFKDLFVVESERQLLNDAMIEENFQSVHGDVEVVLRELLGPGGMLRVLRREGLDRNPRNLFQSYFYFGKDTKWNPLFKGEGHFQLNPMRELWRRTFGASDGSELPDARAQVLELREEFSKLEQAEVPISTYKPVVGLAHGDLNAMNVLIDVMDAVWLIDFAFSEEKPLCWDLTKMEIAFMFEYAVLPVCWRTLLRFAGDTEEDWKERKVEKWLNVSQDGTIALLKELQKLQEGWDEKVAKEPHTPKTPSRRKSTWKSENYYKLLTDAIQRACDAAWPEPLDATKQKKKQTELCRLNATLLATEAEEESAMAVVGEVTEAMLHGNDLGTCLEPPAISAISQNAPEASSILWCWAKCARLRMFLKEEWQTLQVRVNKELGDLKKADQSPLVFWLGLLQESYRLLGYFDVAPWVKVWACFYLEKLVSQIREHMNPKDALDILMPLTPARRASFVKERDIIRPAPDAGERTLRGMALRHIDGKIPLEATPHEMRVRTIHATNEAIHRESGLFVEVGKAVKVQVGSKECKAVRMVERDALHFNDSSIYPIQVGGVEVGLVQINGEENLEKGGASAVVMLNTEVVPVPASVMDKEQILQVPLSAKNSDAVPITLWVRTKQDTVFCYSPGARIRMVPDAVSKVGCSPIHAGGRLRHATVVQLDPRHSGNYEIRWDNDVDSFREHVMVNPRQTNHLRAHICQYPVGAKLVIYRPIEHTDTNEPADDATGKKEEHGGFIDAVVVDCLGDESAMDVSRHIVCSARTGEAGSEPESPVLSGRNDQEEWAVDLNDFNHALRGALVMKDQEEEMRRYKLFIKAKHSLLWTVTSERCDCLEGPVPRIADGDGEELNFWQAVQSLISEDDERISSHIFNQGMIILGQAGSGKTCILCKMVMNCLSRSKMLLPLFIPVTDLAARLEKAATGETKSNAETSVSDDNGEALVDWYLRAVYGDDTSRYFMLRQALQAHRLLLLFDGLDEAGKFTERVELCITSLVAQDHRVIATARPQEEAALVGSPKNPPTTQKRKPTQLACHPDWLKTTPSLFHVVELLPLSEKCRRTLIEVLLSRESDLEKEDIDMAENFCSAFLENLEDDERRKWSTPLMVAMLIASWRVTKREELKKESPSQWSKKAIRRGGNENTNPDRRGSGTGESKSQTEEDNKTNIKRVYGVALDLLLRRFQSRLQADRHKMKARIDNFKSLLEVIANKMTEEGIKFFAEADVIPILEEHSIDSEVWRDLADAIKDGRVPLLRAWTDEDVDEVRFVFAYSSFQNFLSSQTSANMSKKMSMENLTMQHDMKAKTHKRHSWSAALRARTELLDPLQSATQSMPLGEMTRGNRRAKTFGIFDRVLVEDEDDDDKDEEDTESQSQSPQHRDGGSRQLYSPRMPPLPRPEKVGRRLLRHPPDVNKVTNGHSNGYTNGTHGSLRNGVPKVDFTPVTRKSQVAGELLDLREELTSGRSDPPSMPQPALQLSGLRNGTSTPRSSSVQPLPPPKADSNDFLPAPRKS